MITRRAALGGALLPLLQGCEQQAEITGGFNGANPERGHRLRLPGVRTMTPPLTRRVRVLIAGGGVAGLAAARALRLRGVEDFALLEMEDGPGGNSRGGQMSGIACPLGAHYLPVPSDDAREVQDLLEELELRQRMAGRWVYDERHLCHSPQDRLFFQGRWQEGLLPMEGVSSATLAQYGRISARIEQLGRATRFSVPVRRTQSQAAHLALDAQTMQQWLDREGFTDAHLRWYLDYCCRDDYGAGLARVSAWAGIHYFASRHGFHDPAAEAAEHDPVLTWPEGNGWLVRRLADPLGDRVVTHRTVLRIAEDKHGVEVDAFNDASQAAERWRAERCIVALPVFVAARVVEDAPPLLRQRGASVRYAPWVVANLQLRGPLQDRPGAPPSWDNVVYGARSLGYVDARHQSLDPRPGPTVLSWYCAPGEQARAGLLARSWQDWRDDIVNELGSMHPDLASKIVRVEVARYGHAMAIPVPGTLAQLAGGVPRTARLAFAHSDWAGYSVFEEAFTLGHAAGSAKT